MWSFRSALIAALASSATALEVHTGWHLTCVRSSPTNLKCFGFNHVGQLGIRSTTSTYNRPVANEPEASVLSPTELSQGVTITRLSHDGAFSVCAAISSGDSRCWGYNYATHLGCGHYANLGDNEYPWQAGLSRVLSLSERQQGLAIASVGSSYRFSCAILTDNNVRCWGYNGYGELGLGHNSLVSTPFAAGNVQVLSNSERQAGMSVLDVDSDYYHSCAHISDGSLRCWGHPSGGRLGHGNNAFIGRYSANDIINAGPMPILSPGDVQNGVSVVKVRLSEIGGCVSLSTGDIRCWGYNHVGQLGIGNTIHYGDNEPAYHAPLAKLLSPAERASGSHQLIDFDSDFLTSCAIFTGNLMRCWGSCYYGQCGTSDNSHLGDNEPPYVRPTTVLTPSEASQGITLKSVHRGRYHTCVTTNDDRIRCWGYSGYGETGSALHPNALPVQHPFIDLGMNIQSDVQPSPSANPTPSNSPTPTGTPTPSNTPTPSTTPSATPTPSNTPTPSTTPSMTPWPGRSGGHRNENAPGKYGSEGNNRDNDNRRREFPHHLRRR